MGRYLMMIEVSQKQAFIFGKKRLANNIYASQLIRYITSGEFFQKAARQEFEKGSIVYDGGGHTILEFPGETEARAFAKKLTKHIMQKFDGLEVFVKLHEYKPNLSPEDNEKELAKELEKKKALRRASFCQKKFGIEAMGSGEKEADLQERYQVNFPAGKKLREVLANYELAYQFGDLGGSKDERNFIAVVHIDGNLMGKRVSRLAERVSEPIQEKSEQGWQNYKKVKKEFSEAIDSHFKQAYYEMLKDTAEQIQNGMLTEKLDLKQKNGQYFFPVRDIILAGDDVCFVTEGRIGLSCAVSYLKHIWNLVNGMDQKNYSACAGVAIVHQKYPFYRAYELAEELCSNAKKMIAQLDEDASANVCAIDWHIEFGEMENGLAQIRRQYENRQGNHLEMRPYLVCGDPKLLEKEPIRRYENFQAFLSCIQKQEAYARGKLKSLRAALKNEEKAGLNYLKANLLEDLVWQARDCYGLKEANQSEMLFYQTFDGEMRNMLFDAVELMDACITW